MAKNHLYSTEDIKKTYESIQNHIRTKHIILNYSRNAGDIRKIALEGLDLSRVKRVLDLGCGYGFFTESLKGLLKNDPKNHRLYTEIADCYMSLGDKSSAFETLVQFQRLGIRNSYVSKYIERLKKQV